MGVSEYPPRYLSVDISTYRTPALVLRSLHCDAVLKTKRVHQVCDVAQLPCKTFSVQDVFFMGVLVEKVQQMECRTIIFKFREIDASKGFETGSTFSLILKDNAFDEYNGHQLIKLLDFMLMLYEKEHLKIFFLLKNIPMKLNEKREIEFRLESQIGNAMILVKHCIHSDLEPQHHIPLKNAVVLNPAVELNVFAVVHNIDKKPTVTRNDHGHAIYTIVDPYSYKENTNQPAEYSASIFLRSIESFPSICEGDVLKLEKIKVNPRFKRNGKNSLLLTSFGDINQMIVFHNDDKWLDPICPTHQSFRIDETDFDMVELLKQWYRTLYPSKFVAQVVNTPVPIAIKCEGTSFTTDEGFQSELDEESFAESNLDQSTVDVKLEQPSFENGPSVTEEETLLAQPSDFAIVKEEPVDETLFQSCDNDTVLDEQQSKSVQPQLIDVDFSDVITPPTASGSLPEPPVDCRTTAALQKNRIDIAVTETEIMGTNSTADIGVQTDTFTRTEGLTANFSSLSNCQENEKKFHDRVNFLKRKYQTLTEDKQLLIDKSLELAMLATGLVMTPFDCQLPPPENQDTTTSSGNDELIPDLSKRMRLETDDSQLLVGETEVKQEFQDGASASDLGDGCDGTRLVENNESESSANIHDAATQELPLNEIVIKQEKIDDA